MENYKMGIDPYQPESYGSGSTSECSTMITMDGNMMVIFDHKKPCSLKSFKFMAKLMVFLYYRNIPMFDETTKKMVRNRKPLMIFFLKKYRKNLGKK